MQSTLDRISQWMTRQSWYSPSPDGFPRLRELAEVFLPSPDPLARVRILVVRDDAPEAPVHYQLPIVERDVLPDDDDPAFVGRGYGGAALFDGVGDAAFSAAVLAGMHDAGRLGDEADDRMLVGSDHIDSTPAGVARVRVTPYGRRPLVLTVYRRLVLGPHPDADAREALAGQGGLPRLVGTLPVRWSGAGDGSGTAHLALVEEEVAGVVDGWTLATAAARAGESGVAEARAVGAALARMHRLLAEERPVRSVTAAQHAATVGAWRARLAAASAAIPGLEPLREGLERVYDAAAELPSWPALQTIHGALDLAALQRSPDGCWFPRDFGGVEVADDPDRADTTLRDVAGAIRSFHYAGALVGSVADWSTATRRAVLTGYRDELGDDRVGDTALPVELLDAVLADLAVLDAITESRSRPEHLGIPLASLADVVATGDRGELSAA